MLEQKCSNCGNGKWRDGVTAITDTCTKCHFVDKGALGIQPSNWKPKEQTNADRIRAMSDEELAEWLVKQTVYQESAWSEPSYLNFLTNRDDTKERAIKDTVEWLKQPAEVEHE